MAMIKTCKMPVLQEKSASGSVASFNTALAMPLASCNIAVNAWQEGSGDPSPSNVRPIHGFSEVNVTANNVVTTIQLGQEVYGGIYNSVTGKLLITDYIPDLTDGVFQIGNKGGSGTGVYFYSSTAYSRTLPVCALSVKDMTLAKIHEQFNYGTIDNPFNHNGNFAWAYKDDFNRTVIRVTLDDVETLEDFDAIKSDLQLKYPLETPFDIQLTPTQIATIRGNNTIFADTGDVDLTFKDLDIAKRGSFREVFKLP